MLVSEMVRELRVGLNDEEAPHKYSTARLLQWLNGAYLARQLQSSYMGFLHHTGRFILTQVGEADYSVQSVRSIDHNSIYYLQKGTNAKTPIQIKDYDVWVAEQARGTDLAPSAPNYLIEMPDHRWKIEPTPDDAYEIYADRWHSPGNFPDVNSEPLWEDEFHRIVLLDAMKIAASLRPESPESLVMLKQVEEQLPTLDRAFKRRYLTGIKRAGAMI